MPNTDIEELKNLSEEERAYVLNILKEMNETGHSDKLDELLYGDFEETPVGIATFLHDRKYLGNALYDPDGRFTLFPYWEEKLKEIFPTPTDTAYNTVVLTGAIGLGKSTVAVICLLYLLYRLLCLKDPYLHYGLQPIDKLSISLMNITLENAKGVALDKMNQMILSSEWFMSHGKMTGESNLIYVPNKHIELITASSNNQVIGRCLDGNTVISTSEGDRKLSDLVNNTIKVTSIDEFGNRVLSDTCTVLPTDTTSEEYQIEMEDGTVIKCTSTHKFMLKDGSYKEARFLTVDDELFDYRDVSYGEFIDNIIKTRGQWNIPHGEYFEVHHIVPRCLGGEGEIRSGRKINKHPNLIYLYAREHFIAHKLLAKENPDNSSLVYAWSMMAFPKSKNQKNHRGEGISEFEYEELQKLQSKVCSMNNNFLKDGKPWNKGKHGIYSEDVLKKIRSPRPSMQGVKKSESTKRKMSDAVKRRFKEHPEQFGKSNVGKIAITDGKHCKYINRDEQLPVGYSYGQGKRSGYSIKDKEAFSAQKRAQCSGEGNPMYGNGWKISGGKNGSAIYDYMYEGVTYDCRKSLIVEVKKKFPDISESTIRRIMRCNYTKRISDKFQYVIDNLSWKLKTDEN